MLDIACDECGKKYRVDETKMKGARAKARCKACGKILVITNPRAATNAGPSSSVANKHPPVTADIPEPTPPKSEPVPQSIVDRPWGPATDKTAESVKDVSALLNGQKIRFGLFGKFFIVMLIVSLLPFAVFWGITLREINNHVRIETENLILLAGLVLLVLIIAWFSARSIVSPIMKLTDAAERMSLGELNVKIDIKSKDEIGLLAQAIGRMQTSLKLAMNRLRKNR